MFIQVSEPVRFKRDYRLVLRGGRGHDDSHE